MLQRRQVLLLAALAALITVIVLFARFMQPLVEIDSISPTRGPSGEIVVVHGQGFLGDSTRIRIGNRIVPRANIREWADSRIRFLVPGPAYSGLVTVEVDGLISNPVLFTNTDGLPQSAAGSTSLHAYEPFVFSVSPNVVPPGREVTISGRDFGVTRSLGSIVLQPDEGRGEELQYYPERYIVPDSHIILWTNDTIRFYSPNGIIADQLYIETREGRSDALRFELQDTVGTYQYRNPYEIAAGFVFDVQVAAEDAETELSMISGVGNEVVLWLPSVPERPEQRLVQNLRLYPEPRYFGSNAMKFVFSDKDILPRLSMHDRTELIRMHTALTRYSVETTLLPDRVVAGYQVDHPLYRDFLGSSPGIEVTQETRNRSLTLGGRGSNPLVIARNLFAAVRNELNISGDDAVESAEYARLLTSLLRSRDIPARIVTGILFPPETGSLYYHHWVEWYVLDFGWLPMDPYVADAVAAGLDWVQGFPEDPLFYRENLDPYRLTLHHAGILPPRNDRYSVQRTVYGNPVPFMELAYGHLENLAIDIFWNEPMRFFAGHHDQ